MKEQTAELEGLIEKYAARLKERRPMYGGNVAQQGVAPATGGDEVRVLSNDKR